MHRGYACTHGPDRPVKSATGARRRRTRRRACTGADMIHTSGINHGWSHVVSPQEGRHGHMLQMQLRFITFSDMTRARTRRVLAGHNRHLVLKLHRGRCRSRRIHVTILLWLVLQRML